MGAEKESVRQRRAGSATTTAPFPAAASAGSSADPCHTQSRPAAHDHTSQLASAAGMMTVVRRNMRSRILFFVDEFEARAAEDGQAAFNPADAGQAFDPLDRMVQREQRDHGACSWAPARRAAAGLPAG